jgi:hypothetical protein
MADGIIPIRWLALPPVVVVAALAEPLAAAGAQAERGRPREHHPQVELVEVPQPAVAVLEAAEAEVVQQPRPQHRRIFSVPSRICCMSPI